MAEKKEKLLNINLAPKPFWEKGIIGDFLKWAISWGRYIVVLTEFAVLLVFLSRFWLDRQVSDLHDEIKQKQAIVVSEAVFEKDFRTLQKRLEIVKQISAEETDLSAFLPELIKVVPQEVVLKSLRYNAGRLSLDAEVVSENGLATFLAQLKEIKTLKGVTVDTFSRPKEKPVFNLTMTLMLR